MPKYENILFVSTQPLIPQLERSLFLNEFRAAGFRVGYLCVRELCRAPYRMKGELTGRFADIADFRSFRRELNDWPIENTFVFLEIDLTNFRSRRALSMLRDYAHGKLDLYKSVFLDFTSARTAKNRVKRIFQMLMHPQKLEKMLVNRITKVHYQYCFSPGVVHGGFPSNTYVPINYLTEPDPPEMPELPEHYGVYVDQGFGLHPDWFRDGFGGAEIDALYGRLNALFDTLERQRHCEIVIAGHPKTAGQEKFFPGRKVFFNLLEPLVRHADFVVGHDSVGLNYALLYRKPLLLCRDDVLKAVKGLASDYRTGKLAELLNIPTLQLNALPAEPAPAFDAVGYETYVRNYVAGDPGRDSFHIVAGTLNPEKLAEYDAARRNAPADRTEA